ncbi:thylakoid membrane photosystem I accumulation factor [Myxacorys almedinensis]|nr:thylakoid membrane photosystem I accumulation factor [Myxacorys almedinensis]
MNVVWLNAWKRRVFAVAVCCLIAIASLLCLPPSAWAGLEDDHFDGDIFALYAGNGSLAPPKVKLATSLKQGKPALLVFYTDDSRDSKAFATTVSQVQSLYVRALDILAIRVDSLPAKDTFEPTEEGYYYKGLVPKTVIFDQSGQIVLDETGTIPFEKIDDVLRKVFDLLPRSQSVILKRRPVNEVNTELVNE